MWFGSNRALTLLIMFTISGDFVYLHEDVQPFQ